MTISKPNPDEYLAYYGEYIHRVQGDWYEFIDQTHADFKTTVAGLNEAQAEMRPGPNEWNLKEIIGHLSDAERIFSYRALWIARKDKTPLPGMEPNPFVEAGEFSTRPFADLLQEYETVRAASLSLITTFSEDALLRIGTASDNTISVRALAYIIAGHEHHHLESIKKVYLKK